MIEAITAAFGGGSIVTAIVTVLIKLWDRKAEREEKRDLMMIERMRVHQEMMDATAARTNNVWGNSTRLMLALVPQFVILSLLYIGYTSPDTVIWVGQKNDPDVYSILFGLISVELPNAITWRSFNGVVVLPIVFAQAGAVMSYYLVSGMFSRR